MMRQQQFISKPRFYDCDSAMGALRDSGCRPPGAAVTARPSGSSSLYVSEGLAGVWGYSTCSRAREVTRPLVVGMAAPW